MKGFSIAETLEKSAVALGDCREIAIATKEELIMRSVLLQVNYRAWRWRQQNRPQLLTVIAVATKEKLIMRSGWLQVNYRAWRDGGSKMRYGSMSPDNVAQYV